MADQRLHDDDLKVLVDHLKDAVPQYYELAIQLGISPAWVKRNERDFRDTQRCFTEVLTYFINNHKSPTRRTLAEALKKIDQNRLSSNLLGDSSNVNDGGHSPEVARPQASCCRCGALFTTTVVAAVTAIGVAVYFSGFSSSQHRSGRPSSTVDPQGSRCAEVTADVLAYLKDGTKRLQVDWNVFAEKLGLTTEQINSIRSDRQLASAEAKWQRAIDYWFEMSRPLEDFVCALYRMKRYKDADKLMKKYCEERIQKTVCKI